MRLITPLQSAARVPFLQVAKMAAATFASWFIALAIFPNELPVFAAVAAILVVQPSVNQSLGRAIERTVGVIIGVIVAYGIGVIFGRASWIVLISIVVAIMVAWLLRLSQTSAAQVPISTMLVLSIGAARPDYAFDRIVETVIGATIGFAINAVIVPPIALGPAHAAVFRLANAIASVLDSVALSLTETRIQAERDDMLAKARALRTLQSSASAALAHGEESLTLNPRQSRYRDFLSRDSVLMGRLSALVTRTIGMARAVHDRYDDTLATEPSVAAIASELSRAAHDLRLLAHDASATTRRAKESAPDSGELPVLTSPLVIASPHPEHWILIGSLMEDLRRVREEIIGK